jgi:hypothetical protein
MNIKGLGVIAAAAIGMGAAIGSAAAAHADSYYDFGTPSGNIACTMIGADDGTGTAVCKLKEHTWAAPTETSSDCQYAGTDVKLFQGDAPCAGVWPSQIFLKQSYGALPTLAYGQSHTMGAITCVSAASGVTCTDSGTGHFFRVSRDSYQLG